LHIFITVSASSLEIKNGAMVTINTRTLEVGEQEEVHEEPIFLEDGA
jgi:hypothetical protein